MSFEIPTGGFYLWLKLPPRLNAHSFFEACKALKVAVMPGDPFFPQATADHTYVRINYTYPAISDIHEGIRRIAKAIETATVTGKSATKDNYTDLIL
jgi:DNA-binding transcriptional MocR family regulator